MLQCPPQQWIDAYEAGELGTDPRINAAIQDHESDLVEPVQFQATPVTRGMYQLFDPHFDTTEYIAEELTDVAPEHFPMIRASWFDAWVFCEWLGDRYRLPTSFQWEHACRAGTTTTFHFGDRLCGDLANCNGNFPDPDDDQHESAECLRGCTPAGWERYPCNDYGLLDVHGNVWEWCADWHSDSESSRVVRGGSCYDSAVSCRSADRDYDSPVGRLYCIGFRLVRV